MTVISRKETASKLREPVPNKCVREFPGKNGAQMNEMFAKIANVKFFNKILEDLDDDGRVAETLKNLDAGNRDRYADHFTKEVLTTFGTYEFMDESLVNILEGKIAAARVAVRKEDFTFAGAIYRLFAALNHSDQKRWGDICGQMLFLMEACVIDTRGLRVLEACKPEIERLRYLVRQYHNLVPNNRRNTYVITELTINVLCAMADRDFQNWYFPFEQKRR